MTIAVRFPGEQPVGYEWLDDEPVFDPALHLQLEMPSSTVPLVDLGYPADATENKATAFALSSPFRVLSDQGCEVMLETARRLRAFSRRAGERIERVVRGGCYRSRWMRDLCTSPELTAHMASIYGVDVAAHPMPLHLGHLNFEPTTPGESVDKWHHDTIPLDFVMMVTDPATLDGGQFEWFQGTKAEMAALSEAGHMPPADRVVAPEFPGAGWAIALHGDMVVHRAAALNSAGERITMVNGYVATDTSRDDQSRPADLIEVDDHEVLWSEWARFAAWRGAGRLHSIVDDVSFCNDPLATADRLEHAIDDVRRSIDQMRSGAPDRQHHYEHHGAEQQRHSNEQEIAPR